MKILLDKLIFLFTLGVSFLYSPFSFGDNLPSPELTEPPIPTTPEMMKGYEGAFLKMVLTFIALLVGIFFTVWILKKLSRGHFNNMNAGRAIKILEKRALSPKTMLYLVEIGEKQTLVAESQLEVKSLATFETLTEEDPSKE
jgi:flagellar biogenesis protein FliO